MIKISEHLKLDNPVDIFLNPSVLKMQQIIGLEEESVAKVNLIPTKIADGYAEYDVRLVAGQKKESALKKFDVLKAITDEQKFSEMIFALVKEFDSIEKLAETLKKEVPEEELQHISEAARLDGYLLFFSGIQ